MYLRSYEGMGKANIFICGDHAYEFYELDGLFHDHDSFKVSVPDIYMHIVTGGDNSRCMKLPPQNRTVQIEYDIERKDHLQHIREVHHSKFKVLSVEFCTDAPAV